MNPNSRICINRTNVQFKNKLNERTLGRALELYFFGIYIYKSEGFHEY